MSTSQVTKLGNILRPDRSRRMRKSRQATTSKDRHSSLSANSTDQVGEIESSALGSKLKSAQTHSRALLPPPRSPRTNHPTVREHSSGATAQRLAIKLPTPLHLQQQARTTKNEESQKFTQFFTSTTSGSTQRAVAMQGANVTTNISTGQGENTASLRQPTGGTGPMVTTPSSMAAIGLKKSTMTHIMEQEDEQLGSISTVFDLTEQKNRSDHNRKTDAEEERKALELDLKSQNEDYMMNSDERKGPYPPTISSQNPASIAGGAKNGTENQTDSFTNVFKKQASGQNESSATSGSKPWYFFDASSNTGSSGIKNQVKPKPASSSQGSSARDIVKVASLQQNQQTMLKQQPLKLIDEPIDQDLFAKKDSSTGGVVNLYSNSNVNTPNMAQRKSSMGKLPDQPTSRGSSGRLTLRSVHLSSTDDMKDEPRQTDIARIHLNKSSIVPAHASIVQTQGVLLSPEVNGQKEKAGKPYSLVNQSQTEVPSARKEHNSVVYIGNAKQAQQRQRDTYVSTSHQSNLFITTEKKRQLNPLVQYMTPEQLEMSPVTETPSKMCFISPSLDFKVRCSGNAVAGNDSTKEINQQVTNSQLKILTPSFTSSEQLARLRKSDLLIKKKEPSVVGRMSLDGAAVAEDNSSAVFSQSNASGVIYGNQGSAIRESRFSNAGMAALKEPLSPASIYINQTAGMPRDRPLILNAGSPAAVQPNIRDSESSMILAESSKFSQQMLHTMQSSKGSINISIECQGQNQARRKPPSNGSQMRQSSSFSRKSIRKSTMEGGDVQEATSFAFYVRDFFSRMFACCGNGGISHAGNSDHTLRNSLNSSINSNMLQYSFVAVPINNNSSDGSNHQNNRGRDGGGRGGVQRRSKLIQDFKAANEKKEKEATFKRASILNQAETDCNNNININHLGDEESDIVEDDDTVANAQQPNQAARVYYQAPGDRIETSNNRADTLQHYSSREGTLHQNSSNNRITAGTIEIATQLTSHDGEEEFVFQQAPTRPPNPFLSRKTAIDDTQQHQIEGALEEEPEENYQTSASPVVGPSKYKLSNKHQMISGYSSQQQQPQPRTSHPEKRTSYEVPLNLSHQPPIHDEHLQKQGEANLTTPETYGEDADNVVLPIGALRSSSDSENCSRRNVVDEKGTISRYLEDEEAQEPVAVPQQKKRSLKDMITQVPQHQPQQQQQQKNVGNEYDQEHFDRNSDAALSFVEEEDKGEYSDGGANEDDDEEGDQTPDVQKIHFNQTVQALFNIRASGLTTPPFAEMAHLIVNLPEPNHPSKTKTVVFDLDETLIHCVDDIDTDNPQVIIPIMFSEEPEPVLAGINIRPYARECLEAANQHFQVIVFTASEQEYADPIIDYLDPDGSLIQARFYRTSCVRTHNPDFYIKDMRIFHQRAPSDIILVDNSVYSFAFQLDNGVPIVSYYNDPKDEEMLHLKFYLDCLKDCDDVRQKNKEAFQLVQLAETQLQRILEEQNQMLEEPYSPVYQMPEENNTPGVGGQEYSYVMEDQEREDQEDDEDDEFEREHPVDQRMPMYQPPIPQQHSKSQYKMPMANGHIMEAVYEEEDSFECKL